jgi:hypothetical protein
MLKELQHLAMPPPPPPAPLPHAQRSHKGGALASGMIEIVMDDEDVAPIVAAPNDGMVPVLAPPAPPFRGHNRGHSVGEGSFSGRLSRTGERVGRSRKDSGSSIKLPSLELPSDGAYRTGTLRSPVAGAPPPVMYDPDVVRSPIEAKGKRLSTGLHQSEMF